MRAIPLMTILDVVAKRCGVDAAAARLSEGEKAAEARRVYCYLARGLTGADAATIGALVIEDAGEVEDAIDSVARGMSTYRALADLVAEAEIEIRALMELSLACRLTLPTTAAPARTALRLVKTARSATGVALGDLAALGAAYLALLRTRSAESPIKAAPPPAPATAAAKAAPSPLLKAAAAYEAAERDMEQARFSSRERGAVVEHARAREVILKLIGAER